MDILNRTPFKFAYVAHQKNHPGHTLSLIVKGTFRLIPGGVAEVLEEQPGPTGDEPFEDDEEGEGAPRYENDFAPFKPRTDLLLAGSCHPPGGGATVSRVTFGVGPYRKTLGVIGDRRWKGGLFGGQTDPEPFSRMPLRYENSFGGPGFKKNPSGKGAGKTEGDDGSKAQLLPNLENPAQLIKSNRDKPDPVGFGPLGRMWEDRFRKVGSYKGDWLKTRFPAFPQDFDWGFFNCAPLDQQAPYLKGDEELFLENVHPEHGEYRSQLPALSVRAFIQEKPASGPPPFREVPMNLDTLFVDMDAETVTLVWRGLTEVRDEEFAEIGEILVTSQRVGDAPAAPQELQALIPEMLREVYGDDEEEPPPPLWEDVPELANSDRPSEPTGSSGPPSPPGTSSPTGTPSPSGTSAPPETFAPSDAGTPPEPEEDPAGRERIESREELEKRLAAGESAAFKDLRGLNLAGLVAPEADLRGADLRNTDLSNAKLDGALLVQADLDGATFSGASLEQANLFGVSAVRTVFATAKLVGADFRGAKLIDTTFTGAEATEASFEMANLQGARLDEIQAESAGFEMANLRSASLQKANLKSAFFVEALLTEANCQGALLESCNWSKVRAHRVVLDAADLTLFRANSGDLTGASIRQAKGVGSIWVEARLDGADFSYADLEDADLKKSSLVGAKLNCANMPESNFSKADLTRAELRTMNLFQGSMQKSNLTEANLSGSNMYGVNFLDAVFSSTVGEGTNLRMTVQDPSKR